MEKITLNQEFDGNILKKNLMKMSGIKLGFGGGAISGEGGGYGFGAISEEESVNLLHHAYELGIKVYDTAPIYGFGLSEKRLGKAFSSMSKRENVFLISKSGVTWHENKRVNNTNDPVVTRKMLEQSLKDLQSDYIDLYMIHWPDERVDIRRPMEILAKAKLEGKIRYIGLCNTYVEDIKKAQEIDKIEGVQSSLSFFSRQPTKELFPYLRENKISFMSYGTLEKGILSGRVTKERKFDAHDCRSWAPWWKKSGYQQKIETVTKIKQFLEEKGHSLIEMALGLVFSYDEVEIALCGARNISQVQGLVKAFENLPSQEILKECSKMANIDI